MFMLTLCMIHNEPTIRMIAVSTVKPNAMTFHFCSDEVFMCRKHTRCTMICTSASPAISITALCPVTAPDRTTPNAAAVSRTERMKPTV